MDRHTKLDLGRKTERKTHTVRVSEICLIRHGHSNIGEYGWTDIQN